MNHIAAMNTARNINKLLNTTTTTTDTNTTNTNTDTIKLIPIKVPQQTNGSDCGIYAILFMEYLVSRINHINDNDNNNNNDDIETYIFSDIESCIPSPLTAIEYRKKLKQEMLILAKEKLPQLKQEIDDLQLIEQQNDKIKQKIVTLLLRCNTITNMIC